MRCDCAPGFQDHDNNGTCAPACGAAPVYCPLGICVDTSGTALCDEPGLVGYWTMDEPSGLVLEDMSLNNLDGTIAGTAQRTTGRGGSPDGALAAGACWGVVPDSARLDGVTNTTGITLAAWVNRSMNVGGYAAVASREAGGGGQEHYGLYLSGDMPQVIIRGQCYLGHDTPVGQDVWVHLAFTYDGATLTLYQDGAQLQAAPCTQTFGADNNPLVLGGNQNSGPNGAVTERFQGALDDIRLYARALSTDEVAQLAR